MVAINDIITSPCASYQLFLFLNAWLFTSSLMLKFQNIDSLWRVEQTTQFTKVKSGREPLVIKTCLSLWPRYQYSPFAHQSTLWKTYVPGTVLGTVGEQSEGEPALWPSMGLKLSRTHSWHRPSWCGVSAAEPSAKTPPVKNKVVWNLSWNLKNGGKYDSLRNEKGFLYWQSSKRMEPFRRSSKCAGLTRVKV